MMTSDHLIVAMLFLVAAAIESVADAVAKLIGG